MIERIKFWLNCEVFYYFKIVFLLIFKKIDIKMVGEMISTTITYKDWTDKVELKNAIKNKDWDKVQKMCAEINVDYDFNEKIYRAFLSKVLFYLILTIILFLVAIFILVLIIEGRI